LGMAVPGVYNMF